MGVGVTERLARAEQARVWIRQQEEALTELRQHLSECPHCHHNPHALCTEFYQMLGQVRVEGEQLPPWYRVPTLNGFIIVMAALAMMTMSKGSLLIYSFGWLFLGGVAAINFLTAMKWAVQFRHLRLLRKSSS